MAESTAVKVRGAGGGGGCEASSWILSAEQSCGGCIITVLHNPPPLHWVGQFLASDVSESHPVRLFGFG